jgi:hypothetical protein
VRWEAQLRLRSDTAKYEAKKQLAEWSAEVETRLAALRAQKNGEGQPLTKLNAVALAGLLHRSCGATAHLRAVDGSAQGAWAYKVSNEREDTGKYAARFRATPALLGFYKAPIMN